MKIAVFGATGGTGRHVVEQALAAGHTVTALVRNPSKLATKHERLTIVEGDVQNAASVEATVRDQDAVISTLGPVRGSPETGVMATAARNIVAAMHKYRVRRLITLTGAGVADPEDQPKLVNRLIGTLLKLTARQVYEDSLQHAQLVRASDLDWTIVRVPRLLDGPHTGKYRVGYVGRGTGVTIVRPNVADFMLKQLTDTRYLHKSPVISD